jgi:ribosomal protein L27
MAININNDYVEFRVTDTLHQLVDRLNTLTGLVDSNTRLFDSAVNTILNVVDSTGSGLVVDSNLSLVAQAGKIDITADSNISLDAGSNLLLTADKTVTIDAGDKIFLDADSGEILLRQLGTQFGALKKTTVGHELEIFTGLDVALTFDANVDATFYGHVNMPATGNGAPTLITARTVAEGFDEIVSEHDSDHTVLESRIAALEPLVTGLRTDVDTNASGISSLDSDLSSQQALNIENRLATLESQIIQINNRLDILEIFT